MLSLDFQEISTEDFANAEVFVKAFTRAVTETVLYMKMDDMQDFLKPLTQLVEAKEGKSLMELLICLSRMCANASQPIVLMIDEIDSASNNQVFLDFLALLRSYYLKRDKTPIFHSVVLAGVYNIKNLKLKLRPESEHQYNSPWNTREDNEESEGLPALNDCSRNQIAYVRFDIAADFDINMNFSAAQIGGMLESYEADFHTGMDIQTVAEEIYRETAGYPILVSTICKHIDEKISETDAFQLSKQAWSKEGVTAAVKMLLIDNIPLFESMIRHLNEFPEMKQMFWSMLFQGKEFSYNPDTKEISLACMFGYAVNRNGKVWIANRIFETRLYNYFLSEEELSNVIGSMAQRDKSYFIHDGRLDMDMTLQKFVEYFTDIYGDNNDAFIEKYGRKFFCCF